MSTAQAVRNRRAVGDDEFQAGIDAAMRQVGGLPDHESDIDQWADIHRKSVVHRTHCIADAQKAERKFLADRKAEIKRIETEMAEYRERTAKTIEDHERGVKASKAFLAAVEE